MTMTIAVIMMLSPLAGYDVASVLLAAGLYRPAAIKKGEPSHRSAQARGSW